MKNLLIIRHAKSDWGDGGLSDIERPLADRGLKDAKMMGEVLEKKEIKPGIMISSPALRAFSTCRIIADKLGYDRNAIKVEQVLYFGEIGEILKMLEKYLPTAQTICIFGHNPTFSELANNLCPDFGTEMPTCSVVSLELDTKNKSIKPGSAKLLWFDYPKMHR